MDGLTRRGFIKGSAVVTVAGVGIIGIPLKKTAREAPIGIRTFLFGKDPISLKGTVRSDENRNSLRITVSDEEIHTSRQQPDPFIDLPLDKVREVVESCCHQRVLCDALIRHAEGQISSMKVEVTNWPADTIPAPAGDTLMLLIHETKDSTAFPIWMRLSDVRRVL